MVRIIKVKDLEEKKKVLLARSEIYRQTLRLEIANAKYSAALLKKRLNFLKKSLGALSALAPFAALFLAKKKAKSQPKSRSFFSKLLAGIGFARRIAPLLRGRGGKGSAAAESGDGEPSRVGRFPQFK